MATVTLEIGCAGCGASAESGWDFEYQDYLEFRGESIVEVAEENEWRAERVQGDILCFCAECNENGTAQAVLTRHGWQPEQDDDAEDPAQGDGREEESGIAATQALVAVTEAG